MNTSRPEAEYEYSRGHRPSGRDSGAPGSPAGRPSPGVATALLGGGLLGSALLVVAEFTPLFTVHAGAHHHHFTRATAGSHHAYGLVSIAVLAAGLSVMWWKSPGRLAMLAIGILGGAALVIALGHDLPDAHAAGLVRYAGGYLPASSTPGAGFYLETVGGVILLLTGAGGILLAPRPERPAVRRRPDPRRSAS
ncbi:MAG: hypothetical protein WAL63_12480 [Solirubrobacteraceae bacterium]